MKVSSRNFPVEVHFFILFSFKVLSVTVKGLRFLSTSQVEAVCQEGILKFNLFSQNKMITIRIKG